MKCIWHRGDGATAVEFGLLVGLIAVALIGAVTATGQEVLSVFSAAHEAIAPSSSGDTEVPTPPSPPAYDGSWVAGSWTVSACDGTQRQRTRTVSCSGASCDPAQQPSASDAVPCGRWCEPLVADRQIQNTQTSTFLATLSNQSGWEEQAVQLCETTAAPGAICLAQMQAGAWNIWMYNGGTIAPWPSPPTPTYASACHD